MDVSPRDYRAWYGLGQTYELVNMPYYALYYFRRCVVCVLVGDSQWYLCTDAPQQQPCCCRADAPCLASPEQGGAAAAA